MKYPLTWPIQFPRAQARRRSAFKHNGQWHSMAKATYFLQQELTRLSAKDAILSTNIKLRIDGLPYSDRAQPSDPGAAVYFKLEGKDVALACDQWDRVECNVYAIGKHIESIRGQARWGVGNLDQAFTGYLALPAPSSPENNCWKILQLGPDEWTVERVNANYRALAEKYHPDRGGSDTEMALLNQARQEALASLGRK